MIAFIGDFVLTKRFKYRGRVTAKDSSYEETRYGAAWFSLQNPRFSEKTKDEPWYHILCKDGGSILSPESDIMVVEEPYDLGNDYYEEFYFGNEYKTVRNAKKEDLPLFIGQLKNKAAQDLLEKRMKE
jgi:hypothetical protein